MEEFNRQEELLEKYKNGLCTPQEKAVVEHWYNTQSALTSDELPDPSYPSSKAEIWQAIASKIEEETDKKPKKQNHKLSIKRSLVAASIFISIAAGLYYFVSPQSGDSSDYAAVNDHPVKPGGNKAYLTLSNGKRIVLTESSTGTLAMQSGVQITKTADGQVIYKITDQAKTAEDQYNTLEAPKGGQYQIILIDGTKVWLNSASVLKYPARFSASERKVQLTGEAYFEVAKNKKHPFRIITGEQEIEVLGTQFNLSAYSDESSIKTTLVEGSVKLTALSSSRQRATFSSSRQRAATRDLSSDEKDLSYRRDDGKNEVRAGVILKPGQQSTLQAGSFKVNEVDTEEALAWKNGYFIFENDDTKTIMRKLERWYDVEVSYSGAADSRTKVMGTIDKNTDLKEVLHLLEATGKFRFKIEGRRVTIMR